MNTSAPEMDNSIDLTTTQEIIISLKQVKEQQNLSIPQIKAMVDATGTYLSLTTLRRVFAEGSETDDGFSYENTLRPISHALLVNNERAADAVVRAQLDTYLHICQYKMEQIESLRRQIDHLKTEHANRCEMCERRFDEYEQRLAFLRDQIELKDARMDRKDEMISKLLDSLLERRD